MEQFNGQVNSILDPIATPPVRAALTLFLVLYGGLAAPALPEHIKKLFDHVVFRVLVLFLILWTGNRDPGLAIAVAVTFVVIINVANQKGAYERFGNIENFEGPQTAVYPGCMNMTVYDLLESFDNNKEGLLNAMKVSRVPGDVTVTDLYAPLISTYLLNHGFSLKSPCTPPGADQRTGAWGTSNLPPLV